MISIQQSLTSICIFKAHYEENQMYILIQFKDECTHYSHLDEKAIDILKMAAQVESE